MSHAGQQETTAHDRGHGPGTGNGVVNRRQVLAGAGAAAAVAVCPFTGAPAAAAAPRRPQPKRQAVWSHAVGDPRGADVGVTVGPHAEGRFGRMFKTLPSFSPGDDLLVGLAASMEDPRQPGNEPSNGDALDNVRVSGGFTFLGQFVDHDMTRDTTPLTDQEADPRALRNFNSPWFDLRSVYGNGPNRDRHLYEADRKRLRLVNSAVADSTLDLPRRADGTAVIGDPRNDENLIVCQLHMAFMRFHNALVEQGVRFADARRLTQWHFHWLIVHDFLPHIVGEDVVDRLLGGPDKSRYTGTLYRPKNRARPMMPLEYAVAAYRFGHSMIRPEYEMNDATTRPIFGSDGADLRGSCPLTGEIRADWSYFFDIPGVERPDGHNFSRRMDTKLSLPLFDLPTTVVPAGTPRIASLAERNLLRGKRLGLPSGQDVARAARVRPLSNDDLGLTERGWGGHAPLWFYVLKEAELEEDGRRLGTVGGRIVAETILGLLSLDRSSYLTVQPTWNPGSTDYRMGEFLRAAGVV